VDLVPLTIRTLRSAMTREEAGRKLAPSGANKLVRRLLSGPFVGLSDVYIPYRLYKVTAQDRNRQSIRWVAVDAVAGMLDPYEFPQSVLPDRFVEIKTRNFLPERLPEEQNREAVLRSSRRLLFSGGFFRLSEPAITAEFLGPLFYVPYWAGFYGSDPNIKVVMLDAVRRTVEGAKAGELLKNWLMQGSG